MTVASVTTSGRAFRVAPGQNGQPVASFWKFWIEGNELYAMNRDVGSMKVSVHASGQIHLRLGRRDLQLLAPPLRLDGSDWHHALEIRYLIAPDRFRPTPKKLKEKEKAYLIDVADGDALILNLMLASTATAQPVPAQFAGAQALWTTTLADRRHASLIARVMPLNKENQEHLARLRGPDGPKATFASGQPSSPHVELSHVFWSGTGGNVILIVPAGSETIRKLGTPASSEAEPSKRQQPEVECVCPSASVILRAPNGAIAAELILEGEERRVTLSKNEHVTTRLGQLRLKRFDENLLAGERFELPPVSLPAIPSIAGLRPREWNYTVHCSYDGTHLSVSIPPTSVGLLIKRSDSVTALQLGDQVIVTAPPSDLILNMSPGTSPVVAPMNATLLLCDVDRT
jgi:hypothetical protein